jgi:flagellin
MAVVGTNPSALQAAFFLNNADVGLNKAIKRLSSGSRLVDPSDDAAGVAVSLKLSAQARRLQGAAEGALNLISFAQTAGGILTNIASELTRMSDLALRATNGAYSASDRMDYSFEFNSLVSAITAQVTNSTFNGAPLFQTGSNSATVSTTVTDSGGQFSFILSDLRDATGAGPGDFPGNYGALFGMNNLSISSSSSATSAIVTLNSSIQNIAAAIANYATAVSLLNFQVDNANTTRVNLEAANSRIKDLDFAIESVEFAKWTILSQSATAMLAQANTTQQNTLQLLR